MTYVVKRDANAAEATTLSTGVAGGGSSIGSLRNPGGHSASKGGRVCRLYLSSRRVGVKSLLTPWLGRRSGTGPGYDNTRARPAPQPSLSTASRATSRTASCPSRRATPSRSSAAARRTTPTFGRAGTCPVQRVRGRVCVWGGGEGRSRAAECHRALGQSLTRRLSESRAWKPRRGRQRQREDGLFPARVCGHGRRRRTIVRVCCARGFTPVACCQAERTSSLGGRGAGDEGVA